MININILLVEDNTGDARLVQRRLADAKRVQCVVEHATWLSSALTLAKNKNFDVVLLDLSLPDSHGIDTVVSLRREVPNTPIIVLSAHDDLEVATRSMEAGADNFIIKRAELSTDELEREILYSLERQRRQATSKALMQKSVEHLMLDTAGSNTPPPIAALASAHVNQIEDTITLVRQFLERNSPTMASQVEDILLKKGYFSTVQELRSLMHMNDRPRRGQKFSDRSIQVAKEATYSTPIPQDPEAALLEVFGELDTDYGE